MRFSFSRFEYPKKKGKNGHIKFVKDDRVKTESYKSHVVTTPSGEDANSPSWPVAERKPVAPRPITSGKLIKRGGPSSSNQSQGSRRPPAATNPRVVPVVNAAVSNRTSVQAPVRSPTVSGGSSSAPVKRQAPPPPPPAPAAESPPPAPTKPMYKAIYNFVSEDAGEVSFVKDDVMDILEKDENGWWLAKKDGKEGWVPSNYLVEVPAPKPTAAPALPAKRQPPAPPAAAAAAAPKPVSANSSPSAPRHAAVSINGERAAVAATSNTNALHAGFGGPGNVGGVPGWKVALEAKKAAAAAAAGGAPAPAPSAPSSSPTPAARRPGPPAVAPKPSVGPKPTIPPRAPVNSSGPKPAVAARPATGGKSLQEIVSSNSAFLLLLFLSQISVCLQTYSPICFFFSSSMIACCPSTAE